MNAGFESEKDFRDRLLMVLASLVVLVLLGGVITLVFTGG
jgi:hypothetical protein